MDDFGVGYSSLAYLSNFPVDGVTTDRSFISNLGIDAASGSVAAAVIALARAHDLEVTAEGVETLQQVAELQELGCDQPQGYNFARPLELGVLRDKVTNPVVGAAR